MKENWLALYLAIFRNVDARDAIAYIKYGRITNHFLNGVKYDRLSVRPKKYKTNYVYKDDPKVIKKRAEREKRRMEEYNTIIELKKNHTWKQIGEILNTKPFTLSAKVRRYEKRKAIANEPTKVTLTISLNKNTVTL